MAVSTDLHCRHPAGYLADTDGVIQLAPTSGDLIADAIPQIGAYDCTHGEEALGDLASRPAPQLPEHLGVLRMAHGRLLYTPSIPDPSQVLGFEEGTLRGVDCEIWEDDGTEEFRRVRERVERQGYWFAPAGGGEGPAAG